MDAWGQDQEPTAAGTGDDRVHGGSPGHGGAGHGGSPGSLVEARPARRRLVGVAVRGGLLVGVFVLGHAVVGRLAGDPGPGPDPDIGGSLLVLGAVGLTAALGALRDSARSGFRRAAVDWTAAVALLAAIGAVDVLRGWLDDRAAGAGDALVTAADLVGPLVAIGVVAAAAATVAVIGAALGETVVSRRVAGPSDPRSAA